MDKMSKRVARNIIDEVARSEHHQGYIKVAEELYEARNVLEEPEPGTLHMFLGYLDGKGVIQTGNTTLGGYIQAQTGMSTEQLVHEFLSDVFGRIVKKQGE